MHADLTRERLSSVTRPTSLVDPITFFASNPYESVRALWLRPHAGEALVGLGSTATLVGTGRERFRQVAHAWRDIVTRASIEGSEPVLLGGFSFDPDRESTALWDGFPHAQMVLPKRMLAIRYGKAQLTTNVVAEQLMLVDGIHRGVERGLTAEAWQALVSNVEAGIRDGKLGVRKVVLATAREVRPTVSLEAALRALAHNYPTCTIFAFTNGRSCFLGATPERLIALREGTATTMALAASAPRGKTAPEDARIEHELLTDRKERDEHEIVVSALRESLAPVCERVVVDASPRLRKLDNVQHLMTTLRGQLRKGRSVLDLVEQLHPTPALGGFPREPALKLIRQREGLDRGWYAAPIGWMDRHGDGEFVAGIRSALLRETSATLFAGCGIVAGSDPRAEYDELGWKLRPMLTALGVDA